MAKSYSPSIREEVLRLVATGTTYAQISKRLGVAKSTISYWRNADSVSRERSYEHLERARAYARKTLLDQKQARLNKALLNANVAAAELGDLSPCIAKALLAMLYWAEGTKNDRGALIFVNTDPDLVRLYLNLLRAAFPLDERKFRIRLQLHASHGSKAARKYWSSLSNVPLSQFGKIYVKKRSTRKKFRENFQGICTVVYHDAAIRRELLALGSVLAQRFLS